MSIGFADSVLAFKKRRETHTIKHMDLCVYLW